jgi:hypothetical protein
VTNMMCTNPTYENVTPEFSLGTCSYDTCTDSPSQFLRLKDRDTITSSQLQCSSEQKSPSFSPMLRNQGCSLPLSPLSPNTDTESPAHRKRPLAFKMTSTLIHPLNSTRGSLFTPASLASAHECLKNAIQRRLQHSSPLSPAPSYPPAKPDPACPTHPLDMSHLMPPGPRLTQGALQRAHSFPPTTHGAPAGLAVPAFHPTGSIQAHIQGPLLERFLQAGTPPQASPANSSELHTAMVPSCSPGLGDNGSPLPFVTPPGPFQFLFPINPESPARALSGVSETSSWDLASHNTESHVMRMAQEPPLPSSEATAFVRSTGHFVPGSLSVSPQEAIAAAAAGTRRNAERSAHRGNSLTSINPPLSPGWTARTSELSWTLSMASQAGSIQTSDQELPSLQPTAPLLWQVEAVADEAPEKDELTPLRWRYAALDVWPSDDAIVDVRYDREVAVVHVPLRRRYGADWMRRCDHADEEDCDEDQIRCGDVGLLRFLLCEWWVHAWD